MAVLPSTAQATAASVAITSVNGEEPVDGAVAEDVGKHVNVRGSAELPTPPTLVVDAGDSQFVHRGDPVTLEGVASGGDGGPYTAQWAVEGGAFTGGTTFSPVLDTAGLALGPVPVHLEVTDGAGAVAADDVLLFVWEPDRTTLLDETVEAGPGVPDELVGPDPGGAATLVGDPLPVPDQSGTADGETYELDVLVPADVDTLSFDLSWTQHEEVLGDGLDPFIVNDFDLYVDDPGDRFDGGSSGATAAMPERIEVPSPTAGAWIATVQAFLNGRDTFHLTAVAESVPDDPRPQLTLPGPFRFVVGDPQVVHADVAGGTSPVDIAWDLDLDGQYDDGAGADVTTTFPLGSHLVAAKATDAAGYESHQVTAVRVVDATTVTSPLVVIGVADTGINPYHRDFSATTFPDPNVLALTENFTLHPSAYIAGYPAGTPSLDLTLGTAYLPEADKATFQAVPEDHLVWIPGTKIVGAIDAGDASSTDPVTGEEFVDDYPILDEHGHGTASASVAAGNVFGFCPSCLLVFGEAFESSAWMYTQSWIDIVSNSYGPRGNIGSFGLVFDSAQPKEMAEAGQLALYAAGNGVENGFIIPEQTYLPETTGPDWLIRVGAVERSSRKPIVGTGKPVDVSSFGSGQIPSADSHSVSGLHNHSGTSAATPYTAGVFGDVLRSVRDALGDPLTGPRNDGVLAVGTQLPSSPYLADGTLTRTELTDAVFKTAAHDDSSNVAVIPTTTPNNPVQLAVEGYGIVEPASGLRARQVLLDGAPLPERAAEDAFFVADSALRDALWGGWAGGGEDSSAASAPSLAPNPFIGVTPADVPTFDAAVDRLAPVIGAAAEPVTTSDSAETYFLHLDSACETGTGTETRWYMDHADTAGDQDGCTFTGLGGVGGDIAEYPSDDISTVTIPAATVVHGTVYLQTTTPAAVSATATLLDGLGQVGQGSGELQLTLGAADAVADQWVPLDFSFTTDRLVAPGEQLTLVIGLDSTVSWTVGYEGDHASTFTIDVAGGGGGGGELGASIGEPVDGASYDPVATPTLTATGTYSLGDADPTPAPATTFFPRRDACEGSDAVDNPRLTAVDGPDPGSGCGFIPGAGLVAELIGLRQDYALVDDEVPLTLGAGTVSGTVYVLGDGPSPAVQLRMELSTLVGASTVVLGSQSVSAVVTGVEDIVPMPFSFPVPDTAVGDTVDDLVFSIVWENAQGGIYVSLDDLEDGTPATTSVDIPVAPELPLDGVQVSVDDPSFANPSWAYLGTDGTWASDVDLSVLSTGTHVLRARAVHGTDASVPDEVTFGVAVAEPQPDVTGVQVLVVRHGDTPGASGWLDATDVSVNGDWSSWLRVVRLRDLPAGQYDLYSRLLVDGTVAASDGPVTFSKAK
jgi:hypothetical protein